MYMDEDEVFARPKLIDQMAEGMLLPLPPGQEFEYKEDEMSLWSYGYDSDELSSQSNNQSVMKSKITVKEEEKEHQQEKLLFIMGIPILKKQVAQPQNVTDPVNHSPDHELTFEDAAAAGENKVVELEEESHIKCIKPQSLTSQPKRSPRVLEDEGNTMQIYHSALETLLGDAVMPKQHSVAAEGASYAVDELVIKDVGHAFSNEDTGYPMTTASYPSRFISMKSLPRQEVKDETTVSDTSAKKVLLSEDVMGIKDEGTNINFVRKRSMEDTSESEIQCEKDMSIENLSKHFGRPLVDAAKSFGVSRSTFKRICRGLGIERWQYGKRRMKSRSSSKLKMVNDEVEDEEPSIQNFSHLSKPPLQVKTAAQTRQEINVKATYNGVTIRFELLDSSGIAELEDNVIERLKIERDTFSIKYQDDEGDWVLIACDKDVRKCIKISRSLKKTTVKMLVDPPVSRI